MDVIKHPIASNAYLYDFINESVVLTEIAYTTPHTFYAIVLDGKTKTSLTFADSLYCVISSLEGDRFSICPSSSRRFSELRTDDSDALSSLFKPARSRILRSVS